MSSPDFTPQPPMGDWETYAHALEHENLQLKQLFQAAKHELYIVKEQLQLSYAAVNQAQRGHAAERMRAEHLQVMLSNSHRVILNLQPRLGCVGEPMLSDTGISTEMSEESEVNESDSPQEPNPVDQVAEHEIEVDQPPQEPNPVDQVAEHEIEVDQPPQEPTQDDQVAEQEIEVDKPAQEPTLVDQNTEQATEVCVDTASAPIESEKPLRSETSPRWRRVSSGVIMLKTREEFNRVRDEETQKRWRALLKWKTFGSGMNKSLHEEHQKRLRTEFDRLQDEKKHRVEFILPNWKRLVSAVFKTLDWTMSDEQKKHFRNVAKRFFLTERKAEIGNVQAAMEEEMTSLKTSVSGILPSSPNKITELKSPSNGENARSGVRKSNPYAFFVSVMLESCGMHESIKTGMQDFQAGEKTDPVPPVSKPGFCAENELQQARIEEEFCEVVRGIKIDSAWDRNTRLPNDKLGAKFEHKDTMEYRLLETFGDLVILRKADREDDFCLVCKYDSKRKTVSTNAMPLYRIGECLDSRQIQDAYVKFFKDDFFSQRKLIGPSEKGQEVSKILQAILPRVIDCFSDTQLKVTKMTSSSESDTRHLDSFGFPKISCKFGDSPKTVQCTAATFIEWATRGHVHQRIFKATNFTGAGTAIRALQGAKEACMFVAQEHFQEPEYEDEHDQICDFLVNGDFVSQSDMNELKALRSQFKDKKESSRAPRR